MWIRYLFATFILSAHFVVGLAQTTNTALQGIALFGPLVLPVCAYIVSLLFRRYPADAAIHAEDGIPPGHPVLEPPPAGEAHQLRFIQAGSETEPANQSDRQTARLPSSRNTENHEGNGDGIQIVTAA